MKIVLPMLGVLLVICSFLTGVWCADRFGGHRYELQITHDGTPVRIDTRTGVVRIWTAKGAGNLRENDWRSAPVSSSPSPTQPTLTTPTLTTPTPSPKR